MTSPTFTCHYCSQTFDSVIYIGNYKCCHLCWNYYLHKLFSSVFPKRTGLL